MQKVTLTFTNGPFPGKALELTGPGQYVLGRSSACDIQVPHTPAFLDVSRRHCVLEVDPPSLRVRDLGSRNGTFVNGRNIGRRLPDAPGEEDWHPLAEGDELRLGGSALRVGGAGRPAPVGVGEGADLPAGH